MQAQPGPLWLQYAIPALVIAIVMGFRLRGMNRDRPLKLNRLWIVPAIYSVVTAAAFAAHPPVGLSWVYCAIALAAGAALGWQRGKLMRISVDPETHAVTQRTSPAAMLFIVALILVRTGARNAASLGAPAMNLDVMLVTDVLIAFALGLLTATRVEMFLRARRLLDLARGAATT